MALNRSRVADGAANLWVLAFDSFDGTSQPHVRLSVTRAVAEAHGGSLAVFSEPRRGAVVRSHPAGHVYQLARCFGSCGGAPVASV